MAGVPPGPQPLRLLLIGPLPAPGQPIGGAKVIAQQACQVLSSFHDVSLSVTDSATRHRAGRLRAFLARAGRLLWVLWLAAVRGGASQVWLLHTNSRAAFTLAPALWVLSRLRRRPLIVRFIGGRFGRVLQRQHALVRSFFWTTVMRSELVLFETKELAAAFAGSENARWFPNTRGIRCTVARRPVCRRFVFASQIRPEKGVTAALLAARDLPAGCSVDFFGSVMEPRLLDDIARTPNAHYGGELTPDDVPRVLPEYDCLVLPTYWPGEGLPGVIIEAFQCGLPVIATNWMNLSELVETEKNGLLIAPRDTEALTAAMNRLHDCPELFALLCAGARRTGEEYDNAAWYRTLVDWARQL